MAACIMIQGTMSGVGKSVITAALCRIFKQDGYRVAPFKSQNMALNSFVTDKGLEMGRAQAVQAYAAGKLPDARMNPVLLKPLSETGSQLILNGRPKGNYKASDYFRMKKKLVPDILDAYNGLARENDIIVIEGAGSPSEINLKSEDIVNMGLAGMVDSKVLLVGDIDPGGVFAQLYGTLGLLTDSEKKRVSGFIINKFRGDKSLLEPGLSELSKLTGKPVLGVVPYGKIKIEEEDSLSKELHRKGHDRPVDIAVIRLPFISNYTDFEPFENSALAGVRYVNGCMELGRPDLLILPGSKSTIEDLRWLKETGLFKAVSALLKLGTDILGICGGYQMLGETIYDPETAESEKGFGFFPINTAFMQKKQTRQAHGRILSGPFEGTYVTGYEIHHGETVPVSGAVTESFLELEQSDGNKRSDGSWAEGVFGTYLHGIFDSGELIDRMCGYYLKKRGISPEEYDKTMDFRSFQDEQYDKLADLVRKNVDIDGIYSIMGM
ncbi:MAG: cobyric acid synthase [Lachnospiraceae bacterium]|nr:cobyric acid synthase [Lachnospiraceae bacterium]